MDLSSLAILQINVCTRRVKILCVCVFVCVCVYTKNKHALGNVL